MTPTQQAGHLAPLQFRKRGVCLPRGSIAKMPKLQISFGAPVCRRARVHVRVGGRNRLQAEDWWGEGKKRRRRRREVVPELSQATVHAQKRPLRHSAGGWQQWQTLSVCNCLALEGARQRLSAELVQSREDTRRSFGCDCVKECRRREKKRGEVRGKDPYPCREVRLCCGTERPAPVRGWWKEVSARTGCHTSQVTHKRACYHKDEMLLFPAFVPIVSFSNTSKWAWPQWTNPYGNGLIASSHNTSNI